MTDEPLPAGLELTELDPGFRDDYNTRLDRVRAACPIYRDEPFQQFLLTRHEDVKTVLARRELSRDPRTAEFGSATGFSVENPPEDVAHNAGMQSILFADNPAHGRIRAIMQRVFAKRLPKARAVAEKIVGEQIVLLRGRSEFDLVADYAVPIPIRTIAHLMGVEAENMTNFRLWSEGLALTFNPMRTPEQTEWRWESERRSGVYFQNAILARRRQMRDDIIGDFVAEQEAGAEISDDELVSNLKLLVTAGNLTTADFIGNGLYFLLDNPSELEKLRRNPALINDAGEEALRLMPTVAATYRMAVEDMAVAGCPVKKHQVMFMSLLAANHDPAVWDNPHKFDITRERKPNLAFGGGAHLCLGGPLARIEFQVAIPRLLDAFPNLSLAEKPNWRATPYFRGLEALRVRS